MTAPGAGSRGLLAVARRAETLAVVQEEPPEEPQGETGADIHDSGAQSVNQSVTMRRGWGQPGARRSHLGVSASAGERPRVLELAREEAKMPSRRRLA